MVSLVHFYLALSVVTTRAAQPVGLADVFLQRYLNLINDLHEFYRSSSIFFVSSHRNLQLEEFTLGQTISRAFSRRGIVTLIVRSAELDERMQMYRDQIVRPLVVVRLTDTKDINEFHMSMDDVNRSYPIWLLIFADDYDPSVCDYCTNVEKSPFRLRFDTEMLVVCCRQPDIKEWWSTRPNKTDVAILGRWQLQEGFKLLTTVGLYSRREKMNGAPLRIALVTNSAFLIDDGIRLAGFFGNVLKELRMAMNFTEAVILRKTRFGSWSTGAKKWSGAVGLIASGQADIGVGEFTITNRRLSVLDFTFPLILTRTQLYMKTQDGTNVQWSAYFEAFTFGIWMTIVLLVITTTLLLTLIKIRVKVNSFPFMFFEHYLHVWGIFCQQGLAEFPVETPLRIVYFSIFVSALVVSAAYSASLISYLTISTGTLPFSTMEEFAADGSYKLIVLQNSSDYDLFVTASDAVLEKMNNLMKPWEGLPKNLAEGFAQVCNEKVAFYTTEAMVQTMKIYIPCQVKQIDTGRTESLAMILSAHSQYTGLINYHIQRFQDNGMMNRLKYKYLIKPIPPETTHDTVTLGGILPILSVLALGIVLALTILACEKLYFGMRNQRRNSNIWSGRKSTLQRWYNIRRPIQRTMDENLSNPDGWKVYLGHFHSRYRQ